MRPGDRIAQLRLDEEVAEWDAPGRDLWVATDERLGRQVDLVVASMPDPAAQELATIATALARVDSPHLPTVLERGQQDGLVFVATRRVDGQPLSSLLEARGPLPTRNASAVVAQLARAVAACHEAGIPHGGVHPRSVIVRDPDARPPFVLLSTVAALAGPGSRVGVDALGATAPEALNDGAATPAADIYALGCVLWACLSGQLPWRGSDLGVAQGHLNAPVPQLDATDPVARAVNAVLLGCMDKDPGRRFGSAAEVARLLTAATALPTGASPASALPPAATPTGPARARRRRTPSWAKLLVGLVILALVPTIAFAVHRAGSDGGGKEPAASDVYANETAQKLRDVAQEVFPDGVELEEAYSRSWSTEASNIRDGRPRYLEADEWDTANWWAQPGQLDDPRRSFNLVVAHAPPDLEPLECRTIEGADSDQTCETFTTESGTVLHDSWNRQVDGNVVHTVMLPPDPATGRPEVSVTEVLRDLSIAMTLDEIKAEAVLEREEMAVVAEREDLRFPLPHPPPLPSYDACLFTPDTTTGCPEGLK